jgi:hypothetical protein
VTGLVILAKFLSAYKVVKIVGYSIVGCYAIAIGKTYVNDYKHSVESEKWAKE